MTMVVDIRPNTANEPGILDIIRWAVEVSAHLPKRKNSGFDGRVLTTIATYAEKRTLSAWCGQKKIAAHAYGLDLSEVTDSHLRSVRNSIGFLQANGVLVVETHGHRLANGKATNVYHLCMGVAEQVA